MRIWSWLILMCCATSCGECQRTGSHRAGGGTGEPPGPGPGGPQCAQHEFPPAPAPAAAIATMCPRDLCGLNGTWLGAGVPFRTLHLNGAANPEGLSIVGFTDRGGNAMAVDLTGDALVGRPADGSPALTGVALTGASLFLAPIGEKAAYRLTIDSVSFEDFWAQCADCGHPRQAPHYHFTAINLTDGCPIALCDPALEQRPGASIRGTTVMFRGDYYDDATYQVSDAPAPGRSNADDDLFNIACEGTAIYKLYMLRHATASASSPRAITAPAQRTALLRLLTADYCGTGHPFTVNGVPIRIAIDPASPYQVTPESGYARTDAPEIDAQWTPAGAACLGTPRLEHREPPAEVMRQIHAICSPPACGSAIPPSYATSANPR